MLLEQDEDIFSETTEEMYDEIDPSHINLFNFEGTCSYKSLHLAI